jgi:hypothetical protein
MSGINQKLVERLDRLYFCVQCKAVFLFQSDVEDHQQASGHREFKSVAFN